MKTFIGVSVAAAVGSLLAAAVVLMPDYSRPPIESEAIGYRGTGMVTVVNPREAKRLITANEVAPPQMPLVTAGPKASEVYENVRVLGDLSQTQFTRLMLAITEWVAPEQGCTYCHSDEGFADDSLYTKRVARWMIEMTRHINNDWQDHVKETGVTCYTCHRGNNIPQNVWFDPKVTGVQPGSNAMLGYYKALYGPSEFAGDTSLGVNALKEYLAGDTKIRVVSDTALPTGNTASTKQTEQTYALMMHLSKSLGVNCTYCHNTRAFTAWDQSPPARAQAWYGIRLARDLNADYLTPITEVFPPHRLGPHGDIGKTNCATCHQGLNKPLNGTSMLSDYPSLAAANPMTPADLLEITLTPMPLAAADTTDGSTETATPATGTEAPAQNATATEQPAATDASPGDAPAAATADSAPADQPVASDAQSASPATSPADGGAAAPTDAGAAPPADTTSTSPAESGATTPSSQ